MLIGRRGGRRTGANCGLAVAGRRGVVSARRREREGAGGWPACQLAGAPGVCCESPGRVEERGAGGASPRSSFAARLPPFLSSLTLRSGLGSRGRERREGTKEEEAKAERGAERVPARGAGRSARCLWLSSTSRHRLARGVRTMQADCGPPRWGAGLC